VPIRVTRVPMFTVPGQLTSLSRSSFVDTITISAFGGHRPAGIVQELDLAGREQGREHGIVDVALRIGVGVRHRVVGEAGGVVAPGGVRHSAQPTRRVSRAGARRRPVERSRR
jgi:hypothetical protein